MSVAIFDDVFNDFVALYQSGERSAEPWATISVDNCLQWVRSGKAPSKIKAYGERWKLKTPLKIMSESATTIKQLRAGVSDAEKKALKRTRLTGASFSHCNPIGKTGVILKRKEAGDEDRGTCLVSFDIDGIETVEQAEAERDRLFKEIPFVLSSSLSASGKGVWLLVALSRRAANKTDFTNIWWMLAAELQEKYDVAIGGMSIKGSTDTAPSNMISLRFYTHDPAICIRDPRDVKRYELPKPEDVPNDKESRIKAGVLQPTLAKTKSSPAKKTDKSTKVQRQVPSYDKRVEWVAEAPGNDKGDGHYKRMVDATWRDVIEGQTPTEDRIDAYTNAVGDKHDRADVVRAVEGAVLKYNKERQTKALGKSKRPSRLFPATTTMPKAECEYDLGINANKALPLDKVLYVPEQHIWRIWEGNAWRDGTLELISWMGCVGKNTFGVYKENRQGKMEFKKQKATGGRSSTAKNSLLFLRRRERDRSSVLWDDNRRVLGIPNGDCLEITGDGANVRRQRTTDYITQTLPFQPADDWRGGDFEEFLNFVVPDEDTRQYLQRHFGYGLICDGSEPYFLWLRGQGRSGKSTLLRFIQSCIPQHFTAVQRDTLLLKSASRHSTTEAKLANKRIAYWAEARDDGNVDAEKIKGYTGGDEQTSYFMRQDTFDWTPRFLLVIVSNGDLQLANPDDAFYERVRLVDCWTTIPAEERKTSVWRKARSGDRQCLRWLADGAADYVRMLNDGNGSGLLPETKQMLHDRLEWQYDTDTVGKFVEEQCRIISRPMTSTEVSSISVLHMSYTAWMQQKTFADTTEQEPVSQQAMSRRLKQLPGVAYKQRRFGNSDLRHRGFNIVTKD